MTPALTLWLAFIVAAGAIAFFGNLRQASAFAIVAAVVLPFAFFPLGHPALYGLPYGKHQVLGARIDKDVAIFVLINGPDEPRYYRLPYSDKAANDLQQAMDGAKDGGKVAMTIGDDGSPGFAEEAPPADTPKVGETAIIGG